MSFGTEGGGRNRVRWGVAAVLGVMAATWYLWPATGDGPSGVVALGSARFADAEVPLAEEIRDRGREFAGMTEIESWCDAAALLRQSDVADGVGTVAFALGAVGTCDVDPIAELSRILSDRGLRGLHVDLPGGSPATAEFETVRTVELLGEDDVLEMPCEWWNDCPPSGTVTVRSAPGVLDEEGRLRIARMVAAAVG